MNELTHGASLDGGEHPEPVDVTDELIAEHGLSADEYKHLLEIIGRTPSATELGIFSVMWSEHCSYKSSRYHLKKLPVEGPQVIQGPGENAGVVDLGDGQAAIFKMESHNHPSFIEPFQGAATGVGGIMRDVFTMGARPIANLNALRFGAPENAKTRHLVNGVVAGIAGYGNCMGVPTVGGETNFDKRYNQNILVNAMCIGLADTDKIFYSAAKGVGLPVVYVGSKTGRDGIHGATMASAEFDDQSDEKRPTVQVGDPFTEKLLLEACLELMSSDAIIAIQDMGAAGLTSSSVEMADKGGVGFDMNLDLVPQRETGMTAYEMMLSESQERMLMVLKPGSEPAAKKIFDKWDLDFAVIGETTDTGRLVVRQNGIVEANLPVATLADSAPEYQRPFEKTAAQPVVAAEDLPDVEDLFSALNSLMGGAHLCSRRWIWEQYDHMVMGDTVGRPGGDAAVVRVHGTKKGLAAATDVTPRYCYSDPYEGGKQAVVETWRNITAVGATPLAITNCLNFGNPTRPDIMGQFVGCLEGMGDACRALDYPIVSGNVSLYNETNGIGIPPTPAIGGIGLIDDHDKLTSVALTDEGLALILVGETKGHVGQSLFQELLTGDFNGAPPPVDLALERRTGDAVRELILSGKLSAVHDVSDGGLLVAIAEMCLAGDVGVILEPYQGQIKREAYWFGEDQARYLLAVPAGEATGIIAELSKLGLETSQIGLSSGKEITIKGGGSIALQTLRTAHEGYLPNLLA
ncbi:MAG: phosphoribosylformylglycinamidine synthase subunit PurL [Rhodomicrobium sp.]|nr:MAG: phosphoribosylformylglycinamidine synthase subunit PurL [Rhodomicrobium sp.]